MPPSLGLKNSSAATLCLWRVKAIQLAVSYPRHPCACSSIDNGDHQNFNLLTLVPLQLEMEAKRAAARARAEEARQRARQRVEQDTRARQDVADKWVPMSTCEWGDVMNFSHHSVG